MFGNCCGCNKKSESKRKNEQLKSFQDAATQSDIHLDIISKTYSPVVECREPSTRNSSHIGHSSNSDSKRSLSESSFEKKLPGSISSCENKACDKNCGKTREESIERTSDESIKRTHEEPVDRTRAESVHRTREESIERPIKETGDGTCENPYENKCEDSNKIKENPIRNEHNSLQNGEIKNEENSHKSEENSTKSEENSPKSDEGFVQIGNNSIQNGEDASQVTEDNFPTSTNSYQNELSEKSPLQKSLLKKVSSPKVSESSQKVSKSSPETSISSKVSKSSPETSKSSPRTSKSTPETSKSFSENSNSFPDALKSSLYASKSSPEALTLFPGTSKSSPKLSKSPPKTPKPSPIVSKSTPKISKISSQTSTSQSTASTIKQSPKGPRTSSAQSSLFSESELQRQSSILSDVKIEISDNDDDEVFCEGVGPPIKLNENLGAPGNLVHGRVPLPTWFSEEDQSEEIGGTQEPPATPVGRDELALKRHRFFSELLSAAQNATEHKVHFDPLGPIIAAVHDNEYCNHSTDFEALVNRLENVTTRLERVCIPVDELCKHTQELLPPLTLKEAVTSSSQLPTINMSVQAFEDILNGTFAQYLDISQKIGGDVAEHSKIVKQAFQAQLQYLVFASQSKQPGSQSEQIAILQPTSQQIGTIQEFREKHRTSPFFNHLSAISESVPALGWVTVSPAPAPYVKEMNDAGQFYTNRVLKDWKEKDKKHVDWVKSWVQTLTELQAFVKQYHTTGLVWSGKNTPGGIGAIPPPPPPGGCPPPPPIGDLSISAGDNNNDRSALFAQINQGENITRSLKKVTSDMQTHKNPTLRHGPAPFKTPAGSGGSAPVSSIEKPPSFVRDGKKWLIEYQKGNHNLVVDNAEMNNVVYLFRCTDSTVTVKGKINSITLDSCKKTSVVFDTLVSCIEFINCQSVQMQVFGKVPTVSIDKTDGCQVYLSPDALNVEIVSSKSSEMNILVPKGNGDYVEYPVPEQYKTTVVPGKGLSTVIVESKG